MFHFKSPTLHGKSHDFFPAFAPVPLMAERKGVRLVQVAAEPAGQRLDNFLIGLAKGVPRRRLYRGIRKGEVRVNGARAGPDQRLREGDLVRVPPLVQQRPRQAGTRHDFAENILHEDAGLLIINKPGGWAVHGGSGLAQGVIEALRAARSDLDYLQLAHRLDRDTSGLLMLAKKRSALLELQAAMQARRLEKRYLALALGAWPARLESVAAPLEKRVLSSGERRVRVREDGRDSLTLFRPLEAFAGCTLIEAKPVTGRTHQIRVHARHVGRPLLGDEKYGTRESRAFARKNGVKRLFLHSLAVTLPQLGEITAPLPEAAKSVLQRLRSRAVE